MTKEQQILNLLGMARRAGQLTTGEGAVVKGLRNHQVHFVFLASDAGAATAKKITDKATSFAAPVCRQFTSAQLSAAIGQKRTVIAIKQVGFANQFKKLVSNLNEGA